MKLIFSTLITFALIVNSEKAIKEEMVTDEHTNHVAHFEADASFEVGSPFYMDIDKDGTDDFLFHTVSVHEEGKIYTKYMVKGLNENEILAAAGSAAISEEGEVIAQDQVFANMEWSTRHSEILESIYDGNATSYNGTWSGDRAQYVGLKLVKNGTTYFGYAQVSIDPLNENASVTEYSINRQPSSQIDII